MKNEKKPTFAGDVFPAEQEQIRQRRRAQAIDDSTVQGPPNTRQGLVGLAISGGGIRSASFALGVIQGLSRHGLLKHADYLSTVSGGGYIGSCLSTLLNDPGNGPGRDRFPLRYTAETSETPALTHLRNCSNYLSPVGLLSRLRLPNLLLRGILLNIFVFLPFIMLAVSATEVAYEHGPHWDRLPVLVPILVAVFVLMAIAFPFLTRILQHLFNWKRRNAYEIWLTVPLLLAGIVIIAIPLLNITSLAIEHSTDQFLGWIRGLSPDLAWRGAIAVGAITVVFMLAGKASENIGRITGKLLIWLVGLLGPAVIYLIFLLLCLVQIDSPFLPVKSDQGLNEAVACEGPCPAFAMVDPDATLEDSGGRTMWDVLFHNEPGPQTPQELENAFAARSIDFIADTVVRCQEGSGCVADPRPAFRDDRRVWIIDRKGGTADAACPDFVPTGDDGDWPYRKGRPRTAPEDCIYVTRVSADSYQIRGENVNPFMARDDLLFLLAALSLYLFNRLLLNINITSPHGFYRDRLSKAFLFRVDEAGNTVPEDDLKLSRLNAPGTSAPYHLINVALNLQGSRSEDLRGRECDFFTFSRDHCGGDRTGWADTGVMERHDRHLDLATAMAISGAAAAPNMGISTNRALVFIMTLLNIRLGYWLPNPKRVNSDTWFHQTSAKPSLIWKEALGRLDENGSHVNVSDGGHIENLAIYQLLKRQCRFIVAIDGECDPTMRFGGLATLMRFARIDLGVEIRIGLDDLRKDAGGLSANHWCLGEIRYPNGGIGQLLYVKLSVTGDEPEYVRAYREKHPDFPHQPTSDQFFSEAQFEAYRALGEHACEGMLADVDQLGGFAALADRPQQAAGNA